MSSVLRSVRKRKKGHTLGAVDVIDREEYAELEVDAKVELIRSLVPLGLMHIEELLDEEVTALAGERDARKAPSVGGRRHGSNPGTVGLAGQRVPIRVPRIRHVTEREIPLRSYEALHGDRAVNDLWLRRVLYGISWALVHESSRLRAPETSIVLMSRRNPADDSSEEDEVESPSHVQDEIPRQELGLLRSRPRPTRRRHGLVLGGRHRRLRARGGRPAGRAVEVLRPRD